MTKSNKPLVIGFVLDDTLDRLAGAQNYILTLGDYLSNQGHDIHYIVGETKKSVRPNQHVLAKNIKVKFSGNHLSIPLWSNSKDVKKLFDEIHFDVIHVQTPFSPLMSGKVIKEAHKRNVKIVGTYHILPYNTLSFIGNVIFGLWSKTYNKYFSDWINITEPSRSFSKRYYGINGNLIRYPINQNIIDTYCKASKLTRTSKYELLFHGRLVDRKGCQYLLKALHYLSENNEKQIDWKLHISGDGPLMAELKSFVAKHTMESSVVFYGRTTEAQKYQLMQLADVVVYPATSGESFGVVLVEAIATHRPIILAGNNPGYASVLAATPDCLFDPKDIQSLAALINTTLQDKKFRQENLKEQQSFIRDYDVNIVGESITRLYRDVS